MPTMAPHEEVTSGYPARDLLEELISRSGQTFFVNAYRAWEKIKKYIAEDRQEEALEEFLSGAFIHPAIPTLYVHEVLIIESQWRQQVMVAFDILSRRDHRKSEITDKQVEQFRQIIKKLEKSMKEMPDYILSTLEEYDYWPDEDSLVMFVEEILRALSEDGQLKSGRCISVDDLPESVKPRVKEIINSMAQNQLRRS